MPTIEAEATTTGSPADVWALLEDAGAWSRWGSWSDVGVEGGGEHRPGAIRVLRKWPYRLRERVTEWEPERCMGYELVEGMPVQGYRGKVTITAWPDGGTIVRWVSSYDHAGPFTALVLRLAVRDACRRLAKAANGASRQAAVPAR